MVTPALGWSYCMHGVGVADGLVTASPLAGLLTFGGRSVGWSVGFGVVWRATFRLMHIDGKTDWMTVELSTGTVFQRRKAD